MKQRLIQLSKGIDKIYLRLLLYIFLVLALLRDCSLCWDHWKVVQMPHTNQALP